MAKYLIDANLPYLFDIWKSSEFLHVFDLDEQMTDEAIWEYAVNDNLTIILKDADFSEKVLYKQTKTKVIHLRIGNLRLNEMQKFISNNWNEVEDISETHRLTNVYIDQIEGIE